MIHMSALGAILCWLSAVVLLALGVLLLARTHGILIIVQLARIGEWVPAKRAIWGSVGFAAGLFAAAAPLDPAADAFDPLYAVLIACGAAALFLWARDRRAPECLRDVVGMGELVTMFYETTNFHVD